MTSLSPKQKQQSYLSHFNFHYLFSFTPTKSQTTMTQILSTDAYPYHQHQQAIANNIFTQSTESTSKFKTIESIFSMTSQLVNFLNKSLLQQAFQTIHRHSQALKTKQLIYAAIYSKNQKTQKQLTTTRKKKQDSKVQTIKRQKQQSFHFNTDDISTIVIEKSERKTIGQQSRIDLENLLDIGTNQINNKFISTQNTQFNRFNGPPYFLSAKRSRTDKSFDKLLQDESFCRNLHFENFKGKDFSIQKGDRSLEYSETIKIKSKLTKETDKQSVHKIFIFRETSQNLKRPLSQDFQDRVKFIKIPLKSKNVKIIECNKSANKQRRSSHSLNQKNCLNTCTSASFKYSPNQECKYCQKIQKSREMLEKWQKEFYSLTN